MHVTSRDRHRVRQPAPCGVKRTRRSHYLNQVLGAVLGVSAALLPLGGALSASASLPGDVNGDCRVTISDLGIVASRFGVGRGSLLYSPAYDLNHSGTIDIGDIQFVAARFGQHC